MSDSALPPAPAPLAPVAAPGMPPVPGAFQPAFPSGALPQRAPAPVGRPAADPEVQEEKIRRSAEAKRVEAVLPRSVDSKLLIYQFAKGQTAPRMNQRPAITVLVSDIESAKAAGQTTDDFISDKINEKFPAGAGRLFCRFVDRGGKPLNNMPPFEMGEDDASQPGPQDEQPLTDAEIDAMVNGGNGFAAPPSAPPAPSQIDPAMIARVAREERADESRRGNEVAQLVSTQGNQMMAMLLQQQAESRRADEQRRADEAARRAEFRNTLLTLLPLVLPMVERLFKRDAPPTPTESASEKMMLEMFRAKLMEKPEGSPLDKIVELITAISKQQLELQAAGARSTIDMSAQANSMMFKNVLETMKDIMAAKPAAAEKEDMLDKLLPLAPALLGALQGKGAAGEAAPAAPAPAALPQPAANRRRPAAPAPAAAAPAALRRQLSPQRQQVRARAAALPAQQRTTECLEAIQSLSNGTVPPAQRLQALVYVLDMAPPELIAALRSGQRDQVIQVSAPAVLASQPLQQWLAAEHHQQFLTEACQDLRLMIIGGMTRERMQVAIRTTAEFAHKYHDRPMPVIPPPAPRAPAAPAAGAVAGPPVVAIIPEPPVDAPPKPRVSPDGMIGGPVEPPAAPAANANLAGPPAPGQTMMPVPDGVGVPAAPPPPPAAPTPPRNPGRPRRGPPPPQAVAQAPALPAQPSPEAPQEPPEPVT